jgi:hypothetical protein
MSHYGKYRLLCPSSSCCCCHCNCCCCCFCPAVWWAASTFYPVGAGHNIAPYTLAEVVFTMIFMALNILLWGFILGSISLLVARSDEQSAKYRQRMVSARGQGGGTWCWEAQRPGGRGGQVCGGGRRGGGGSGVRVPSTLNPYGGSCV